MSDDIEEVSRWAEYRVVCPANKRHTLDRPTVRSYVLSQVEMWDRRCGPHQIEQRTGERTFTAWGPMMDTDPQQQSRDAVFVIAQSVVCPKCAAAIGDPCLNLTELNRGVEKETAWPHTERLDAGLAAGSN